MSALGLALVLLGWSWGPPGEWEWRYGAERVIEYSSAVGLHPWVVEPSPQDSHEWRAWTTWDWQREEWVVTLSRRRAARMTRAELRWVAAHEVCHILLHGGELRSAVYPAAGSPGEERAEREADRCAAVVFGQGPSPSGLGEGGE